MLLEDFDSFFNVIYDYISADDFSSVGELFSDWLVKNIGQVMGWQTEQFFKFFRMEEHADRTTKDDNKAHEEHEASRAQINLLTNAAIDISLSRLLEAMQDVLPVSTAKMTLSSQDKETLINLGNRYKKIISDYLRSPYSNLFSKEETQMITDIMKKIVPPKHQWLSEATPLHQG